MLLIMAISQNQTVPVWFYHQTMPGKPLMERLPIRCCRQNIQDGVSLVLSIRFKGLLACVGFNEGSFCAH